MAALNLAKTGLIEQLRGFLRAPELIVRTWMTATRHDERTTEAEVRDAFERLDPMRDELFPAARSSAFLPASTFQIVGGDVALVPT